MVAYQTRFKRGVSEFRAIRYISSEHSSPDSRFSTLPEDVIEHTVVVGFSNNHRDILRDILWRPPVPSINSSRFSVCARKKPFDESEGAFDCIDCVNPTKLVVHEGLMHRDGRTTLMDHNGFDFDHVFDHICSNDEVFATTAGPLLQRVLEGFSSTMMMFGQTGTGKTYTSFAMQERLAEVIYSPQGPGQVTVVSFEMMGARCFDLLNDRQKVSLLFGSDGLVHVHGVDRRTASSQAELMEMFGRTNELRAVRAMERNHQSSRSHALTQLIFSNGAVLSLVDLAGSERQMDTRQYTRADHEESADINEALMTLKLCFHEFANGAERIAFRAHPLTQVLRGCFEQPTHRTILMATLSPRSSDVDHTLNTIRHVQLMRPVHSDGAGVVSVRVECCKTAEEMLEEQRFSQWAPMRVKEFLRNFEDGVFVAIASAGLDGRQLLRLSKARLVQMVRVTREDDEQVVDEEAVDRLFHAIRDESRRVDAAIESRREFITRLMRQRPFLVE